MPNHSAEKHLNGIGRDCSEIRRGARATKPYSTDTYPCATRKTANQKSAFQKQTESRCCSTQPNKSKRSISQHILWSQGFLCSPYCPV